MNSSIEQSRICVVIPVYNEVDFLDELIEKVSPYVSKIICVDDGSTDGSYELLDAKAEVELITNSKNYGKGYSLRVGLLKANETDCDFIVTMDGDLQHTPEQIPEFIKLLKKYDVVVGNRLHTLKGMPFQRIVSNKLTSWLLSKKIGEKIKDSQSGYRAFKRDMIIDILPIETGFEAETEMLIKAASNNLKIGFVDIPTIYNDNKSKMKPIAAIFGFIKVLLKRD
ncbi:MAG: glycosyltransferase family 2 protein [Melioribacteraceae bacterium]|nr:glycosyltransferase family 2 protein [Melioribacteraceae bacterium]